MCENDSRRSTQTNRQQWPDSNEYRIEEDTDETSNRSPDSRATIALNVDSGIALMERTSRTQPTPRREAVDDRTVVDDRTAVDTCVARESSDRVTPTRRAVLIGAIGSLPLIGSGVSGSTRSDLGAKRIECTVGDVLGWNPDGVPKRFEIGLESTEVKVFPPESFVVGQYVTVTVGVKPIPNGSGTYDDVDLRYEDLATAVFAYRGQRDEGYTITGRDFVERERDLTSHSQIELSDFAIEPDLHTLSEFDERTITNSFAIRIEVIEPSGTVIARAEDRVDVTFSLSSGFGANFGYNFGVESPAPEIDRTNRGREVNHLSRPIDRETAYRN